MTDLFLILGSDPALQEGERKAGKAMGETQGKYRTLEYLDRGKWVPAVYHESVRHYLIRLARKRGEYGEFVFILFLSYPLLTELDHPRESGIEPDDVTSFLESQKSWGPERDKNWPEILYTFEKKDDRRDPAYSVKRWKVGTRLVLSGLDSLPLLDYRDIPATLSSALEGRDMEAIKRIDPRIKQRDFIARMPMKYTTKRGIRKSVQSATSIGMKMTRFRQKNGLLSWVGREGSQTIRDALWESLPEWNKRNNSIRGLKPPTEWEQEKVREGNIGKFDKNAGDRALPEDVRNERKAKKQKRLQRLRGEEGEGRVTRSRAKTTAATRAGNGKPQSERVDRRKRHDTDERQPVSRLCFTQEMKRNERTKK